MHLKDKPLYNLLRLNWLEDRNISALPWQVENYRKLSEKELFHRLASLGLILTKAMFLAHARECETPEELADLLWLKHEDVEGRDHAYLLLFELWRRLLSKKWSLSLFCDELDYRIEEGENDAIQEILEELEDLLDESVDAGEKPKAVFARLSSECAHDIETFLYDYIDELLEDDEEVIASELVEGFFDYMSKPLWFELLRAKLFMKRDPEGGILLVDRILEELQERPDPELSQILMGVKSR